MQEATEMSAIAQMKKAVREMQKTVKALDTLAVKRAST